MSKTKAQKLYEAMLLGQPAPKKKDEKGKKGGGKKK